MPLQVWLPLIDNLNNYGINNLVSAKVQTGVSQSSDGKLGKCYKNTGTTRSVATTVNFSADTFSLCAWVRIDSRNNNWCRAVGLYGSDSYMGLACEHTNGTGLGFHYYKTIDGTNTSVFDTYPITSDNGVWVHYVMCYDGTKYYIYKNGSLVTSANANRSNIRAEMNTLYLFGGTASGYSSCSINDIRLYDHALSPKEVKLLSQGLVAHYLLNDPYTTDNLIPNGYGQDGATGWNNGTNFSTSEIPSGHPEIKASFYDGNATTTFIPISQGTTYTLSAYLKAKGSGTSYPSIFPYDADKHIIMTYNCADGFSNSYRTTLAQPLKKGDTVIYAADLSNWTTGDNYYYHVAIFGYKDSQGRVYPDMGYTADSPSFGSKTDKSHINKTNNTITLNSAFAGEDRPAGTVICQTTEGSTYYYPFGAVNTSSVSDWTLKTAVLSPSTTNRLKYAKYINYMAYYGLYHAGIKLVDNNFSESYIYDSSGYNNHGTRIGGLTVSTNTARNTLSTQFVNGSYIQWANISPTGYANTYTFAWWGKFTIANSTMQWGFANGNRLNLYMYSTNCYWNTGNGTSNPFNVALSAYGDNNWHHFAITGDGATSKLYLDGEYKGSATTYVGITGTTLIFNGWDTGNSYNFNGSLSDFRLYATPLSADDIKQLYNTPESIANNGSVLTQGEFVEV